ncbi:MAG: acyl-CoA thioesterase [Gemmatimonadales bacterium]|nr:MAG: acyl-CoA thioesterase [Gemmatimonadales bacterium]
MPTRPPPATTTSSAVLPNRIRCTDCGVVPDASRVPGEVRAGGDSNSPPLVQEQRTMTEDRADGTPQGITADARGPSPFRFRVPVPVRFRDIDVGAHAHHSHALAYFEEARWEYWTRVAKREARADAVDYILAEARLRYRARILYPDTLSVGVRTVSVGRTHVELEYEVRKGGGEIAVTGSTVLVMFDYAAGRPAAVSGALRERLESFEGEKLPRRRDPSGQNEV